MGRGGGKGEEGIRNWELAVNREREWGLRGAEDETDFPGDFVPFRSVWEGSEGWESSDTPLFGVVVGIQSLVLAVADDVSLGQSAHS